MTAPVGTQPVLLHDPYLRAFLARFLVANKPKRPNHGGRNVVVRHTIAYMGSELFDPDLLDDQDPFEIDIQAAHLFKHPHLGLQDIQDVWTGGPLFYPAKPPAHWLMCAEVAGRVLVDPLAPARDGDPRHCRPIGCYEAARNLANQYRRDR